MTTIAADDDVVHVPAGRDPAADQAKTDSALRADQAAYAKAAAEATDPAEAERLGEVRDYLRDILRRRRLATDYKYRQEDEARRAHILADETLDPRLRDLYLDTRILDNKQLAQLFGVTVGQIWDLAAPMQEDRRPRPHPRMSPEPDVTLGVIGSREQPGIQRGKAEQWWRWSNRGMWKPVEGEMVKNTTRGRYGRPRRTTPRERPRGRQRGQTDTQ